ncbi:MAG: hypothetical protein M5R36_12190 [Deltaproteobacteria bacterium]|nr:hypothetical protein [Deltaproteobacteria bacterium]
MHHKPSGRRHIERIDARLRERGQRERPERVRVTLDAFAVRVIHRALARGDVLGENHADARVLDEIAVFPGRQLRRPRMHTVTVKRGKKSDERQNEKRPDSLSPDRPLVDAIIVLEISHRDAM